MRRSLLVVLAALALGVGAVVSPVSAVSAQDTGQALPVSEDVLYDAAEYAQMFDIGVSEALERLSKSGAIGALGAELEQDEPSTFAGLWVENEPAFKVVLAFTSQGPDIAARHVPKTLAGLVELRTASATLADLVDTASSIRAVGGIVPFDVRVDVPENRVEVLARYPQATDHGVLLPDGAALPTGWESLPESAIRQIRGAGVPVVVMGVQSLSRPASYIYGGLWLSPDCTSGFSVRDGSGRKGVTAAGHCPDNMSYGGQSLWFMGQKYFDSYDIQWHWANSGFTVKNWAQDMIPGGSTPYYRVITSYTTRSAMYIGQPVCKYGKVTGYGCGTIVSKTFKPGYVPGADPTFIELHHDGVDLASRGDSGGPYFYGGTAFGTLSGEAGINNIDDGIFMAANYIVSGLGVSIMTSP